MKKIVFLGCENSHAATFLNFLRDDERYADAETIGVYSNDRTASEKLAEKYGVKVLDAFDDAVGQADGVIVTARHGDDHLKFARPYMQKGATMFIDKPITVGEEDALALARQCRDAGVKVTGGSCCRFHSFVRELKHDGTDSVGGATIGGFVRCPVSLNNAYGGFFFYAQHLVEIAGEIFGRYPEAVRAFPRGRTLTVVFRYETFDVTGLFADESYSCYFAARASEKEVKGSVFSVTDACFKEEFDEFHRMLGGEEQPATLEDLIAPVFVMNAVHRSIRSGQEEKVRKFTL